MSKKLEEFKALSQDEFCEVVLNGWSKISPLTTKEIAQLALDNNVTNKSFSTISTLTKTKLKELLVKELKADTEEVKPTRGNGSNSFAKDIINVLDDLKKELQEKPLNPFVKRQGEKALDSLIARFEDNDQLEKMGLIGNIVVIIFTVIDVFIDIKTIPKKIKEFKEKRAEQAQKMEAQTDENTNKQ